MGSKIKDLIKGLIPRLLILGIEILAIFAFWTVMKSGLPGNDSMPLSERFVLMLTEEFYWILIAIIAAYIFAGIAIIISWIFNFATDFDDYDFFTQRLKELLIAPLTLIIRILKHIKLTFQFAFEVLFDSSYSSAPRTRRESTNYDFSQPTTTKSKSKCESELDSYVFDLYMNTYRFETSNVRIKSLEIETNALFKTVYISGKMEVYCGGSTEHLDDYVDEQVEEIASRIWGKLSELSAYNDDFDPNKWKISTSDLSVRAINGAKV